MRIIAILALLTVLIGTTPVLGQSINEDNKEPWEFVVAPYLWMANLGGEVGAGIAGTTDFHMSFGDLLKSLRFTAMLHAEVQKGHWGGMFDMIYMSLGEEITTPRYNMVDIGMQVWIVEGLIDYRFLQPWGSIEPYAGIRYWNINMDLALQSAVDYVYYTKSGGYKYVDPVIGVRGIFNISERWSCSVRTDIGGFGAGSRFSFNIQPTIGYHFSKLFSMSLHYRYLTTDYETGESGTSDYFLFDVALKGPLLGFIFTF